MNPKKYEVNVYFNNNLITTNPKLDTVIVTNDYNSIKLNFNFDIEATKYVFKLLNPSNEVALISEIENNTLTIGKGYITEKGLYQFEIAGYGSDSRLTNYFVYSFMVRQELIESDEIELPEEKISILDSLISEVSEIKEDVANGDYNGATFVPNLDEEGNLSWENDKGLENPETVNIKGDMKFYCFDINEKTGSLIMYYNDEYDIDEMTFKVDENGHLNFLMEV